MSSVAPADRAAATRGAWLTPEPAQPEGHPDHRVSVTSLLFVVGVTAMMIGLAIAMATTGYDIWGGVLIGMILLLATVPIATRSARRWNDPSLGRLMLLAAFVKLSIGSALRYYVAIIVYGGSDANRYYDAGTILAPFFRHGDFGHVTGNPGGSATQFTETISGIVISVISESRFGEFVVFSWVAFLGLHFFYEAFRIAFPQGDHRRYRLLVFFWPSLLFWPSSVGKDAWMVWMLGMCALGIANLYVGRWRGFMWMALGTAGCIEVRPHLALIIMPALAIGLLLRRNRGRYSRMLAQPVGTVVLLLAVILVGSVIFAQTEAFFKLDSLDFESAQGVLDSTSEQTGEGGTAFTPASPNSPVGYVEGAITVMFRPFPIEVHGNGLFTGMEGVLLMVLVVRSRRRLMNARKMSLQNAYVAFAVTYTLVFIYAFTSISNFGILARERSQFFPVLFVLLALPKRTSGADAIDEDIDAIDDTALVTST